MPSFWLGMTGAPPWHFSAFLRNAPPPSALSFRFVVASSRFDFKKFFVSVFLSRIFAENFSQKLSSMSFVKAFDFESFKAKSSLSAVLS
nr:MAG TPA: hypothetical protein [Caudoviricetes sp.]